MAESDESWPLYRNESSLELVTLRAIYSSPCEDDDDEREPATLTSVAMGESELEPDLAVELELDRLGRALTRRAADLVGDSGRRI